MKYLTVEEMINIERAADRQGHSYQAMMEAAGKGLAEVIHERYHQNPNKTASALIGSGNNGGDALVALDYLISWGWKASALLLRNRQEDDPLIKRFQDQGGFLHDCTQFPQTKKTIQSELSAAEIVIDGVLGTGIKLPLRSPLDKLLTYIKTLVNKDSNRPVVVAVDCPSGMDCDTGQVDQGCLPANLTVTMAGVKQGLLKFPAYDYVGDLVVVDIGLPADLKELKDIKREMITSDWVKSALPKRPLDAHKGVFGTALIIAGSDNYPGAAVLAGISAYKSGAGLVTMAVPKTIYHKSIAKLLEATWIALDDQGGGISAAAISKIKGALDRPTVCLVGPGLGIRKGTRYFLDEFYKVAALPPLVIDADGLRLTSELENWLNRIPALSVLTPHPGEMSVLSGLPVAEIQANRVEVAETYAREWNQVLLLKGAHTVISEPGGQTKILLSANPALAKGGTGDVLAGIIAGLIAQGVAPFEAAAAGAWIHSQAGAAAAEQIGNTVSVLAGDVANCISDIFPQ